MSYSRTHDILGRKLQAIVGPGTPVYLQSPENVKLPYPCLRYKFEGEENRQGNNRVYAEWARYTLTYISKNMHDDAPYRLQRKINYDGTESNLVNCKLVRTQVVDGLYHWIYNCYEIVQ